MQSIRSIQRKRTLNKFQSTVGTRKGRRGRNLALRPDEPAAVHELMAEDATPNLRVWQMYEEAEDFEDSLVAFRDLLMDFEAATDVFLQRLEPIMRSPLPRVWDAVEGGLAEPVRATISHAHQHTVGGDISIAGLEETRSQFHNQIKGHVIRPLEQWSEALDVVEQERLPALKRLRRQVVKHSRNVARYSAKYHRKLGDADAAAGAIVPVSGRVQKPGGVKGLLTACTRPRSNTPVRSRATTPHRTTTRVGADRDVHDNSSEADTDSGEVAKMVAVEDAGMRLNYKHRKLQAARGDYFEAERVVAEQLEGLCRDGAWLKSYMAAALLLGKEAMQMAVVSLGNTKQPLPGFTSRYGRVEHGILRDNVELAAMMPPELKIRRAPLSFGSPTSTSAAPSTSILPSEGLHAHKATTTPMELSARPDAHALEWVSPTATGAAAVPLDVVRQAGLSVDGDQTPPTATARSSVGRTSFSGMYDQIHHDDSTTAAAIGDRPALGGRRDAAVAAAVHDREQYHSQADSARLAGSTPGVARSNAVWGSEGRDAAAAAAGGGSGTPGFRVPGSERSGFKPSNRQLDDHDREQLRERGRGVMSTVTGMLEGAAHAVGLGSRSSSSSSSSSSDDAKQQQPEPVKDTSLLKITQQEAANPVVKATYPSSGSSSSSVSRDADFGDSAAVRDQEVHREVAAVDGNVGPEVCGRGEFTVLEDRPMVKERVTKILEHRPVVKQYETALKYVGESAKPGSSEYVGDETRTVSVAQPQPEPEIRDRREFTEVEDRPLVKERVTRLQESHPVEKKYETALKYVGEQALPGSAEPLTTPEEHIMMETPAGPKCPANIRGGEPVLAA